MKKIFILLIVLMLGISFSLASHEKYSEKFEFSPDKSNVSSVFVTTSFETLKTWNNTKIAQYYFGLNERRDTIIRNLILSPTGRYNYPGDSLVYSWSKLFAKTRVFHREFVVNQDMRKIDVEIKEGESIPVNWGHTFVLITKFLVITMVLLLIGKNDKNNGVIFVGIASCVFIIALTIVCSSFSHFLRVTLFDYFFIMLLVLLPPLLISFRKSKADRMINKAMRDMDRGDYP